MKNKAVDEFSVCLLIEAYAEAKGQSVKYVSQQFLSHTFAYQKIKDKRMTMQCDRCRRLVKQFEQAWPRGAKWPPSVPKLLNV